VELSGTGVFIVTALIFHMSSNRYALAGVMGSTRGARSTASKTGGKGDDPGDVLR
jgi:ABC-type xylose transport system permease subunit